MVTAEQIWEAIQQDGDLVETLANPEQQEIMREYVEKRLLTAMGDLVKEVVTSGSICMAKLAFIEDALEYGLMKGLIEAIPEDEIPDVFDDAEEMAKIVEESMAVVLQTLHDLVPDIPSLLEVGELDERDFFAELGLSHENIQAALSGALTIGDLLTSQPGIILTNQE